MIRRLRTYISGDGLGSILIKAVVGSAGVNMLGMGFGFLVGVQLARSLGAEGYGVYGLAMSIIALLTVPTAFGLPQLLTREVSASQVKEEWGRIRGILRWSTRTSLLISTVIVVGVSIWLKVSESLWSPIGKAMLAGIVMVPIVALLSIRSAALRGAQKIVKGQLAEVVIRPALHSVFLFLATLALVRMSPAMAMWLGVAAAACAWIVADRLLYRALPRQVFTASPVVDSHNWWISALPMAMTEGMRLLQSHLLIFFLGAMVTMTEVGLFRMAASTVLLISMPLSLFNIVSMPVISRLHAVGRRTQLQKMLMLVSLGMAVGVLTLSFPFLMAGDRLLGLVFGDEFSAGSAVLSLLCVSAVVNALFGASAALLNMTGHQARVTKASIVALIVLTATAVPLIHYFGIYGAACANLASVFVWRALMWRDCRKLLSIETGAWGILLRKGGRYECDECRS